MTDRHQSFDPSAAAVAATTASGASGVPSAAGPHVAGNPVTDHAADAVESAGVEPTAWTNVGAHLRFWTVAVGGLALDLWSKHAVFIWLRQSHDPVTLVPYVLSFHTMFNPGALFGIGAGQTAWFLVASVLALILVFWMFGQSSPRRYLLQIALGGILAGALGNMYDRINVKLVAQQVMTDRGPAWRYYEREDREDRILLHEFPRSAEVPPRAMPPEASDRLATIGYVRDFIKINSTFGGHEVWPWVFNVADMLLVGGVGILAIHMWRDRKPAQPAAA